MEMRNSCKFSCQSRNPVFRWKSPALRRALKEKFHRPSLQTPAGSSIQRRIWGGCLHNTRRGTVGTNRKIPQSGRQGEAQASHLVTRSRFAQLRGNIDDFRNSMPSSMVYNEENLQNHAAQRVANQFLYLHIIVQQNMLFLYRFAIPVSPNARPHKDIPKQFLREAGRYVVETASQISHLVEQAAGHTLTAPFAGYCAYVASTVQVWGVFSQNPQLEAVSRQKLRHTYQYLSKMKKYWGILHHMAENVKMSIAILRKLQPRELHQHQI